MKTAIYILIIAVVSYLLGCANGAVIVSTAIHKTDVRDMGSGNAGLTNFYRNFGGKAAVWVIVIDIAKAVAACLIAGLIMQEKGYRIAGQEIAMLFTVLGHMFPVFFEFRGGKGILTCFGAVLVIDWRIALGLLAVFVIVLLLSKIVSLSSMASAVLYPVAAAIIYGDILITLLGAVSAILIIAKHGSNLKRVFRGEEPKFKLK